MGPGPKQAATEPTGDPPPAAGVVDASAPTASVAIMTEPSGAAVFVNDELRGTSPLSASLPPGATVEIRVELAGYATLEQSHTVAARAETVRLELAALTDAAPPVDAGSDAMPKVERPTGRTRPEPRGNTGNRTKPPPKPESPTGGSTKPFDPDNVSGE
jgi:hypothetical protein